MTLLARRWAFARTCEGDTGSSAARVRVGLVRTMLAGCGMACGTKTTTSAPCCMLSRAVSRFCFVPAPTSSISAHPNPRHDPLRASRRQSTPASSRRVLTGDMHGTSGDTRFSVRVRRPPRELPLPVALLAAPPAAVTPPAARAVLFVVATPWPSGAGAVLGAWHAALLAPAVPAPPRRLLPPAALRFFSAPVRALLGEAVAWREWAAC